MSRPSPGKFKVYLEVGNRRTFAAALEWPGWCRSGRDEAAALQALFAYGPRYARVLRPARLGFQAPKPAAALVVAERLTGNATTDFGAPDLALTLILVEALTVVLFAVVITRLPPIRPRDSLSGRLRDAGIALLAGAAAGMVVWKAAHVRLHESISPEFMARSLSEANGRNVVNVILVDFRALDTLGEIMVLGVAALGVYALVRMRSAREDELGADKQEKEDVS